MFLKGRLIVSRYLCEVLLLAGGYMKNLVFAGISGLAFASTSAKASDASYCMAGELANKEFQNNSLQGKHFYTESHGARVQREHPKTYLFGQTKYLQAYNGAVCQYSNHVGLVFTLFYPNVEPVSKEQCISDACSNYFFWREEWAESGPELDRQGYDRILVCVEERSGIQYPSVACGLIAGNGDSRDE